MKKPMVTQDAHTFVALGRAMSLAAVEGALEPDEFQELAAALVAGILSGCMELDTYARVHDAMARLLEHAFHGPPITPSAATELEDGGDESLGVYLEVVGEAWEKVGWNQDACGLLKGFVARSFDLSRGRFGEGGWFRAPLQGNIEDLTRAARGAGLLVVSVQGEVSREATDAVLEEPTAAPGPARVVLGWGDRRTALDLS
jgi:hypothetical protein